jgi:ribosomal protein L33
MKVGIKFCPNCKEEVHENKKLAQGVVECKACDSRFYILLTSTKRL